MLKNITCFSFYLWLATFPFAYRQELFSFVTGFHEYETAFFYLSDWWLLLFVLVGIIWEIKNWKQKTVTAAELVIAGFLLVVAASAIVAPLPSLSLYFSFRLSFLAIAAILISKLLKRNFLKKEVIWGIVSVGAVFQAGIVFLQFKRQKNIGLDFLGEPILQITNGGVSKILVDGARVLRAYGTFLHPNILAAFLILGGAGIFYFYLKKGGVARRVLLLAAAYFISMGIILTFSRTAWLAAAVMILILLAFSFYKERMRGIRKIAPLLLAALFAIVPVKDFVFARAAINSSEPAVTERISHNQIAMDLIRERPGGVGAGNQVFYSYQTGLYQKYRMEKVWEWQPIHNLYLLIASETGLVGLGLFILLIATLFISNLKRKEWRQDLKVVIALTLFLAFGLMGLADHFFWTIGSGQAMWWLAVGLLL